MKGFYETVYKGLTWKAKSVETLMLLRSLL